MELFSDNIDLSDELKGIPIKLLIEKTVFFLKDNYKPYSNTLFNKIFIDLADSAKIFKAQYLTEEFIKYFTQENISDTNDYQSSDSRKKSLNMIANAMGTAPVFQKNRVTDKINNIAFKNNLISYGQYLHDIVKSNTIYRLNYDTALKFLLFIEKIGKKNISDITKGDISDFIVDLSITWSPNSLNSVPGYLKSYLKFAEYPVDNGHFPIFSTKKNCLPVIVMSRNDVESLWNYIQEIHDDDLRSKAIIVLLLLLGMGADDIANLKIIDIDRNKETIGVFQTESEQYINFKLFPLLGSIIARYIAEERYKGNDSEYLFLNKNYPYANISPTVCNHTLKDFSEKIGAQYIPASLHCPTSIRRSLVSIMISKGVSEENAKASIGYIDGESIDNYFEPNVDNMRQLCLDVPPIMKGWL